MSFQDLEAGRIPAAQRKRGGGAPAGQTASQAVAAGIATFQRRLYCRKQKDLYLWMVKSPGGPSIKFLANLVNVMSFSIISILSDKSIGKEEEGKQVFNKDQKYSNPVRETERRGREHTGGGAGERRAKGSSNENNVNQSRRSTGGSKRGSERFLGEGVRHRNNEVSAKGSGNEREDSTRVREGGWRTGAQRRGGLGFASQREREREGRC
ncbi:hypothetical protein FCM35_KLT01233 [Carex littledalei]|uniref:Uncharacterized protein n=1 Tax=Carex littledalei TaxID=544730 RepID=A0A833R4Q5_9POAL|nr:hypothetical protein FCM35_KLT01233 [Carex littledalei]